MIASFDICGPLPTGVTVLEASAGTGKTFTIAALAARYVAEGTRLEELLLVTFTRMATGELRDRVRERLVSAEAGLGRVLAGVPLPTDDDVFRLLATGEPDEIATRRRNLATALADFDAATIATTHGFCQHVLSGLGVAGDVELDVSFLDDVRDLVAEVVDDLYVRKFVGAADAPPFTRKQAGIIGRKAVDNPDADLEPQGAFADSDAAMRVRLAAAVRAEVERRKRGAAILTYDDLLTRLRQTLADPVRGPVACAKLRDRYKVALVDEFQDTDPVQWDIMRRAFGSGDSTLVLIGDPKQAIYAFRGADVYAYLDAAKAAGTRATLGINWRSDQGLIDAYDAVFGGTKLGHEGIAYRTVRAAPGHEQSRVEGAPVPAPLRVRILHRDEGRVPLTPKGYAGRNGARAHVAADLAGDVVRLLSSGAELIERSAEGEECARARIRPGHIAVLVSRHREAALVREALSDVGVPAVINGGGSVFATPSATHWLRLLEALERPTSTNPAHAVALTPFLGWTARQVAAADDAAWESVHARLHQWAGVLRRRGVAAMLDTITHTEGLPGRMLAQADGERQLTDLRHIGQLLHAVAISEQLGITALTTWLRQRIAEAESDQDSEDRSRRLDSDAEAVQVLTIYRSKGLEFPVVYCPYLWEPSWIPPNEPAVFHDPGDNDRRKLDVSDRGGGWVKHQEMYETEERGEDLRLAYVALTRAQHQAVVWWAGSWDSRNSALSRLVFARDDDGVIAAKGEDVPADEKVRAEFARIAGEVPGCISVERTSGGDGVRWVATQPGSAELAAGRFDRTLDSLWRRTSYSGITAGTYEARVASEAEEPALSDEDTVGGPHLTGALGEGQPDADGLRAVPSLLAAMPAGAEVGTFVHGVLERVDFTAADLSADLAAAIEAQQARRAVDLGDPALAAAGLFAAIDTPLGPLVGEARLRDIATSDRIDELGFELPLVGGDVPTTVLALDQISSLLVEHLPADDVLAPYAERLRDPRLRRDLRGYLSGSMDLVLRVRTADGAQRFAVVDYKTNKLGFGEDLTAWHYRPDALTEEMYHSHYPLQALLYTVALHRYLRWRLPGYTPEANLAGILYLFVRGMVGADAPRVGGQPCGVFAWRPPAALVEALSDLLDVGCGGVTVLEPAQVVPIDPADVRLVHGATGLLREFNAAGVLATADVHVALRLGRLGGVDDDDVLLAVALAVRAPRLGHVCTDLESIRGSATVDVDFPADLSALPWPEPASWLTQLAASPLVATGVVFDNDRPLRLVGSQLYLDRYWREERRVAADLIARAGEVAGAVDLAVLTAGLERLFSNEAPDLQRLAAATAVLRRFTVVGGGPGTGKTTTVARIIALLDEQAAASGAPAPLVALAAPTGKAAARLAEAVHQQAADADLDIADSARTRLRGMEALTLHRLLGWRPGNRSRFKHDRANRLPHDVVIVDETSMVSLSLMAKLVEAVRTNARLIVVGDPQQLSSVEAGAVLGDVVGPAADRLLMRAPAVTLLAAATAQDVPATEPPPGTTIGDGIVILRTVHRFKKDAGIATLAEAIRQGDPDAVIATLRGADGDVTWIETDIAEPTALAALKPVQEAAVTAGQQVTEAARQDRQETEAQREDRSRTALAALGSFRLLCAHRRGPYGVATWTERVGLWLAAGVEGFADGGPWYVGRPLLITENDYALRLFNGDTGVVVETDGRIAAVFERSGHLVQLSPNRLSAVDTVYAMTIHKSQGSQFDTVAVLLPDPTSRILTRELLYTAVTRAQSRLILAGTEEAIRAAVERPIARASGLRDLLWAPPAVDR